MGKNTDTRINTINIFGIKLLRLAFIIVYLAKLVTSKDYSNYAYNNSQCVTYSNLRYANYSTLVDTYNNNMVFPENYCYGVLSYNITKEAFDNIIEYNLEAFKRYRRFLNLFHIYNTTTDFSLITMDSGCLPYFRYISCYSVFNACQELDDGKSYVENTICSSTCTTFYNRCGVYTNLGVCLNNSTESYCAGINNSSRLNYSYLLLMVIMSFIVN